MWMGVGGEWVEMVGGSCSVRWRLTVAVCVWSVCGCVERVCGVHVTVWLCG